MRKLIILLGLLSCASPFAPKNATSFTPLPIYSQWWQEVEACSGLHGDMSKVKWAIVNVDSMKFYYFNCDGIMASGCWVRPNSIYIVKIDTLFEGLVKHEIQHDLLQRGDHPTPPFKTCTNGV
jgi:hypothetical protein